MSPSAPSLHFAPGKAIAYSLSAIICLSVLDALVKWLAADYAITQIAFLRYIVGIVLALGLAARHGGSAAALGAPSATRLLDPQHRHHADLLRRPGAAAAGRRHCHRLSPRLF
jgi:hypothetical protein